MVRQCAWLFVFAMTLLAVQTGLARTTDDGGKVQQPDDDTRLDWWREARFGMFIHWGLYAIPAGQWNGQTNHAEWIMTTAGIPVDKYEQFVNEFNPVKFDADAWCRMAKDAGMKYIVITSKHHDGFALFDSAQTQYDVMSTPFKRDIMAEMASAARRHGLKICWYHSILDWHNPDYRSKTGLDRYITYLRAQVTELLTNYGDIGVMWFDGEWEPIWTHGEGLSLYNLCRKLQPNIIVNNRVDKGRDGMAGLTRPGEFAGDFGTPEQEVPALRKPGIDWESCVTMNDHWGYNSADKNFKSTTDLIHMLVDIVSKGGNFLLNVGPTAQGEFPPESVDRLREIGNWMRINGESIYGTTASPFENLTWGRCTVKQSEADVTGQSTLYLHIFKWPLGGILHLDGLANDVVDATLLADPRRVLSTRFREGRLEITVGRESPDEHVAVVRLNIEGRPNVIQPPMILAESQWFIDSLGVSLSDYDESFDARYTIDGYAPNSQSSLYKGQPIRLWTGATLSVRLFADQTPVSAVRSRTFEKITPMTAARPGDRVEPGLSSELFNGTWDRLPDFDMLKPTRTWTTKTIGLEDITPGREFYGLRLRGLVRVESDGIYELTLQSDDGARCRVNGQVVVDLDGLHVSQSQSGVIGLARGWHWLEVEYFNKTGNASLGLNIGLVDQPRAPIASDDLVHVAK